MVTNVQKLANYIQDSLDHLEVMNYFVTVFNTSVHVNILKGMRRMRQ